MHIVFSITGIKEDVDKTLNWLQAQVCLLPFENIVMNPTGPKNKDGDLLKKGIQPITAVLRYGLLGTWELIVTENDKDKFLTFLDFDKEFIPMHHQTPLQQLKLKARLKTLQLALGCEPTPKFTPNNSLVYPDGLKEGVRFIPIGVRYDDVTVNKQGILREQI